MTNHRYQHNLTFNTIKKWSILAYTPFVLIKRKVLLMHTIICETYGENVIDIRTCELIWTI